ncbi:hypothetical protein RRG08_045271 [Elysia crispata]|uniref:Uncharacterized protein n=1 Tax=Elysia crispata TaxID=231223 RepID=A0AAE1A1K1_9GAST|nr:hypothetical protein RRG08_045271 [Elysia crispata]
MAINFMRLVPISLRISSAAIGFYNNTGFRHNMIYHTEGYKALVGRTMESTKFRLPSSLGELLSPPASVGCDEVVDTHVVLWVAANPCSMHHREMVSLVLSPLPSPLDLHLSARLTVRYKERLSAPHTTRATGKQTDMPSSRPLTSLTRSS